MAQDKPVGRTKDRAFHTAARLVDRAGNLSQAALDEVGDRARSIWMPEDPDCILTEAPGFAPLATTPHPQLLSASWRADALLGLSALGVTAWESELVGVTRSLFHDGLSHQDLSHRLFGADYDSIHRWIDTVPGTTIRGGGIVHRLQHGHDLAAANALYDEHGLPVCSFGCNTWHRTL